MKKTKMLYPNVQLLAVNEPHASKDSGGVTTGGPKSYRLIRLTSSDGKSVELLMETTFLTCMRSLKNFFINNGHIPVEDNQYWLKLKSDLHEQPNRKLKLSPRPGYVDGVYLLGNGDVIGDRDLCVRLHPNAHFRSSSILSSGSLKDWKKEVASLAAYSDRMMLALCVSFSGLILKWVDQECGGFHFHGESTDGKTTAIVFASTVYGNKDYLASWDVTEAGLEDLAVGRNDALLPLNELKLLDSDPVIASQKGSKLVYLIAEGKGRQRAKNYQNEISTWRTVVLSSGELSLADHAEKGSLTRLDGERVRVIDLPANSGSGYKIFDRLPPGYSSSTDFAEHVKAQCQKYYGTALIPYVEGLLKWKAEAPGSLQKKIQALVDKFLKKCGVDPDNGQEMRIARRFGVAFAAGAIARELDILNFENAEIGKAIKNCYQAYAQAQPVTETQKVDKAYQKVLAELAQAKLLDLKSGKRRHSKEEIDESVGFVTVINGVKVRAIKRESLQQWIGVDVKLPDVISKFKLGGALMPGLDGDATRQVRTGADQKSRIRCYCFLAGVVR
jgi:hypothetical protein